MSEKIVNGVHYHDTSVEDVAAVLMQVNPRSSLQGFIDHMHQTAGTLSREGNLGYVSTFGYVMSLYARSDGGVGAVASLSPSILKGSSLQPYWSKD